MRPIKFCLFACLLSFFLSLFLACRCACQVVMLAAGSGITPMLQILQYCLAVPGLSCTFVVATANRTQSHIPYRSELRRLHAAHAVNVRPPIHFVSREEDEQEEQEEEEDATDVSSGGGSGSGSVPGRIGPSASNAQALAAVAEEEAEEEEEDDDDDKGGDEIEVAGSRGSGGGGHRAPGGDVLVRHRLTVKALKGQYPRIFPPTITANAASVASSSSAGEGGGGGGGAGAVGSSVVFLICGPPSFNVSVQQDLARVGVAGGIDDDGPYAVVVLQ